MAQQPVNTGHALHNLLQTPTTEACKRSREQHHGRRTNIEHLLVGLPSSKLLHPPLAFEFVQSVDHVGQHLQHVGEEGFLLLREGGSLPASPK